MWHKEKGVQGFHLVQSFAVGEVSPELAHQIGLEFADRLLGGHFQAVVSTCLLYTSRIRAQKNENLSERILHRFFVHESFGASLVSDNPTGADQ